MNKWIKHIYSHHLEFPSSRKSQRHVRRSGRITNQKYKVEPKDHDCQKEIKYPQ